MNHIAQRGYSDRKADCINAHHCMIGSLFQRKDRGFLTRIGCVKFFDMGCGLWKYHVIMKYKSSGCN